MTMDIQQSNYERTRPVAPKDIHSPIDPIKVNLTTMTQLNETQNDEPILKRQLEHRKEAQGQFKEVTEAAIAARKAQIAGDHSIEALHLSDLSHKLHRAQQLLKPIISHLEQKYDTHTNTLNTMHSNASAEVKRYSGKDGQEIRQTIRSMSKKEVDFLLKKPATSLSPEVWAAISENPAAGLYLTKEQMNQARSKVLHSLHENFDYVQHRQEIAEQEINSLNSQITNAKAYVSSGVNRLKQKYPSVFNNMNIITN